MRCMLPTEGFRGAYVPSTTVFWMLDMSTPEYGHSPVISVQIVWVDTYLMFR